MQGLGKWLAHAPVFTESEAMKQLWLVAAGVLVMAGLALPAAAVLGENANSVQKDQARMRGTLRITPAQAYTTHEIQSATGVTVREYVAPASGNVFAVTWKGPRIPNLRQLLGSYYQQYARAAQARRGHGPLIIELPGLVVQSAGHQRAFVGRAYLPPQLPAGVRAERLQ